MSDFPILRQDVWEAERPKPYLVVAYYTDNTPYQHEAEVLKVSLESVGLSYCISAVPNQGSWQKNTQLKARFLKRMFADHPGRPLLYLDVDAVVVQDPVALLNIRCDLAAVHFAKTRELLSGTVYFSGSKRCCEIVDKWIGLHQRFPETLPDGRAAWDQRTLEMAIKQTPGCRFVELPQEYTWIVQLTQKWRPGLAPIIMHTRGAKRFKHLTDSKPGYAP